MIKRLELLLKKYVDASHASKSTHQDEFNRGRIAAIRDLLEELKIENRAKNDDRKYKRDRKKRLGF